jgi:hypothetical protein
MRVAVRPLPHTCSWRRVELRTGAMGETVVTPQAVGTQCSPAQVWMARPCVQQFVSWNVRC